MASVLVFVDDAVRGTLPGVCAKDGTPTTSGLTVRDELGDQAGLGVLWLLALAGPIGWLGLFIVSLSRSGRREVLTVQVPMSDGAHERLRSARRLQQRAMVAWVGALLVGLWSFASYNPTAGSAFQWQVLGLLAATVFASAFVALFVADHRRRDGTVQVDLDASRRWVTLSGVHPAFVAACRAHEQRQSQRT